MSPDIVGTWPHERRLGIAALVGLVLLVVVSLLAWLTGPGFTWYEQVAVGLLAGCEGGFLVAPDALRVFGGATHGHRVRRVLVATVITVALLLIVVLAAGPWRWELSWPKVLGLSGLVGVVLGVLIGGLLLISAGDPEASSPAGGSARATR